MLAMALLAFGAALPYGAVLGTLNAWLEQSGVKPSSIAILSFITLAYAYKFLWAPAFHRPAFLIPTGLGPRRAWLLALQVLIGGLLVALSRTEPANALIWVAGAGLLIAIASATHDIVLDAWRIEVAETPEDPDTLTAIYQFSYRLAGLASGMGALLLSTHVGWATTFLLLGLMMAVGVVGTLVAPEPRSSGRTAGDPPPPRLSYAAHLPANLRSAAVGAILLAWALGLTLIGRFMWTALTSDTAPSGWAFIRQEGPWIVGLCVGVPGLIAALLFTRRGVTAAPAPVPTTRPARAVQGLFSALVDPLMDLVDRLRWGALLVVLLVLSYRFTDAVWGALALPFYLGTEHGAIGHTTDEIAFASKMFGVLMTVAGSALGALAIVFANRMACLLVGAVVAAATNLLYADLSLGGAGIDVFLGFTGIGEAMAASGLDARMSRLLVTIGAENIAGGFASVVYVAYLTAIVNPRFAAVQYALLASLTMLIGTLGRAPLGAMVETDGYAAVFTLSAWLGGVAVVLTALEWLRTARTKATPATPAPLPETASP
jgi:PAT family beta-lactamase induction signal transducer AmpG